MRDLAIPHESLVQVTREYFYRVIYELKLDVHPKVVSSSLGDRHYVSVWRLRSGTLFGWTRTDSHGSGDNHYRLSPEYLKTIPLSAPSED